MGARVVFLGDDFTGASDSLSTYARNGWAARLRIAPPDAADGGTEALDALGIPTDLRSLDVAQALAEVDRLWPAIRAENPQILHFKVCSTFDSGPGIGSIGAVARDLSARFSPDVIAVLGGQPSLGRYCAFGTLFARGPDGAVHRIDRHPVMARHPVTPMTEADLARHLAAQGLDGLCKITLAMLDDPAAMRAALGAGPVLFDATEAGHQDRIAEALASAGGRQLLIGASSVAEVLTRQSGTGTSPAALPAPPSDRVLIFAGSRSPNTRAQVGEARSLRAVPVDRTALLSGRTAGAVRAMIAEGASVLLHLNPEEDYRLGPGDMADASADLIAAVLDGVAVGHLGLAGGDTSSRICHRLGFEALDFETDLGAGVCICTATHARRDRNGMRIMLKGGQMGSADLFDRFAARAASLSAPA